MRKPAAWPITAGFALMALAGCLFEGLRQSYCSAVGSLPLFLLDLAAPSFLALSLVASLCPVFAGRRCACKAFGRAWLWRVPLPYILAVLPWPARPFWVV